MYVVKIEDPDHFRVEGPFSSTLQAREYLADTRGDSHNGEVIYVEPLRPEGLIEPGL